MVAKLNEVFAIGNTVDFTVIDGSLYTGALITAGYMNNAEIMYEYLTPELHLMTVYLSNVKTAEVSSQKRQLLKEIADYEQLQKIMDGA